MAVTLQIEPTDISINVLVESLAITSSKLMVIKKKDIATPSATLANGIKISGPVVIAKMLVDLAGAASLLLAGESDSEKASISKHIDVALILQKALNTTAKDAALNELNKTLESKVFASGTRLSLADYFFYSALYTSVAKANKQTRLDLCNITRYFDLIQHLVRAKNPVAITELVDIDLDVPVEEIQIAVDSKKKSGDVKDAGTKDEKTSQAAPAAEKKAVNNEKPASAKADAETKEKKEKKGKGDDKKVKAEAEAPVSKASTKFTNGKQETEVFKAEPERLDLRVGYITSVKKHPDAESLFVEEIDVGEDKPRTVVSGLVKYMKEEDLLNRKVVLLCNLKPAKMRGIESQAMVLAATSIDGTIVELLDAPASSKAGDRCWFDSHRGTDFSPLNTKKKTWETVQPTLKVDGFKQAVYSISEAGVTINRVLRTSEGEITVKTVIGASIK
ncbi:hypothetical protein HK100_000062 [Physocladia obscura]|uniref:tRNA-binding domain-containing protein n=1 Tax=Physocladia obscura TaxID=109957 RepID=A0AAD5SZC1_9FUNG|nr:hypothetical protein HK100_000062 [Physocladia obscura]